VQLEATSGIYQRMIGAYREPDRAKGRAADEESHRRARPRLPGRTDRTHRSRADAEKRAADVLAYRDRAGYSNGPEALNGRLEHLRGARLGFRNLTSYIARILLETGGFRPQLHARS
jgi:transposase